MESLIRDLRYAARGLGRSPWFALAVVASIGLGVGANTTVFAWLDNIVGNPFPGLPNGRDLVAITVADADGHVDGMPPIAYPVLDEWRPRLRSFQAIAAHAAVRLSLRAGPSAIGEPVWVEIVSGNYFDTVRAGAELGRVLQPADAAARAPVVVLSHAFWQRRFGGDPSVLGRSVLFNGAPLTVIGVATPRFDGVVMGLAFDAWVPLWQQPLVMSGTDWSVDRTARRLQAVARLNPGADLRQANTELLAVATAVSRAYGESPPTGAAARWVRDTQLGSLMGPLGIAMIGVAAIVLLAACANVAGLLLARSLARRRQTAIHIALGAPRGRLVQQALAQSGLLALAGLIAGLWMAAASKDALAAFAPRVALPVSLTIDLNWRVIAFATTTTMVAASMFGVVPAWRASRAEVIDAIRNPAGAPGGGRRGRLRPALVVAQVAFALMSLIIAGLFLRSVSAAGASPLGFTNPDRVLLASTDLTFTALRGDARAALIDRALSRLAELPAARAAALSTSVPLSFGGPPRLNTRIDRYTPGPNEVMLIGRAVVSPGYFALMDIPIVAGRDFGTTDRASTERVVIVNRALASRYWPGQSGLGRRIDQGNGPATVVGVVSDSVVDSLTEAPKPLVYHAFSQVLPDTVTLHIRSDTNPLTLVEPVRRALATINADLPVLDPGTLRDHMRAGTFVQALGSSVFSVLGVIALLISAMGLYAMVAGFVAEYRREIAVRAAVGASPAQIAWAIVRPAMALTAAGLGLGLTLAIAAAMLVRNQLPGVSPVDPVAIATAVGALAVVAGATCLPPIWLALRIDPVAALRPE